MIKDETRFAPSNVMEGMTSLSALFAAKDAGVNDRLILEVRFDKEKARKKTRELAFLREKCAAYGVPLTLTDGAEIEKLAVGTTHGGVIALCGQRTLPRPTADVLPQNGFLCYLDGVEDPYNFGFALRSLYAAGCDGVLLGERNWLSAAGVAARPLCTSGAR